MIGFMLEDRSYSMTDYCYVLMCKTTITRAPSCADPFSRTPSSMNHTDNVGAALPLYLDYVGPFAIPSGPW
jgi:hypothetical protein